MSVVLVGVVILLVVKFIIGSLFNLVVCFSKIGLVLIFFVNLVIFNFFLEVRVVFVLVILVFIVWMCFIVLIILLVLVLFLVWMNVVFFLIFFSVLFKFLYLYIKGILKLVF